MARGAAMRSSLTPTSERVTPEMLARIQQIAGDKSPAYNAFGDKPSTSQRAKLAAAKARGDDNWRKAGQRLKAEGYKKGGTVKKYAKGGKIDGCAKRGRTRSKGSK